MDPFALPAPPAPLTYRLLRGVWSAACIALLAVATLVLVGWASTDGQGNRALMVFLRTLGRIQAFVSDLVPYPWEVLLG